MEDVFPESIYVQARPCCAKIDSFGRVVGQLALLQSPLEPY